VADYLEVDRRYERAVEACLGELLQHVIVERHDQARPVCRWSASTTPDAAASSSSTRVQRLPPA
jgi:hypothetical protein